MARRPARGAIRRTELGVLIAEPVQPDRNASSRVEHELQAVIIQRPLGCHGDAPDDTDDPERP